MKKLYALAILTAAAFGVQAQSKYAAAPNLTPAASMKAALPQPTGNMTLAVVDSILDPGFSPAGDPYCDTISGYYISNTRLGGFYSGNNRFGDREKLMRFRFPATGTMVNVQIAIAKITTGGAGNTPMSGVFYSPGTDGYPDSTTRETSTPITMRAITNGYNRFQFPNAPFFTNEFFVGLALPQGAGDTVIVYQSRFGTAAGGRHPEDCLSPDTAGFERALDGSFWRTDESWGFPFEFAVAPQIRYDDAVATKDLLGRLVGVRPIPATTTLMVNLPDNITGATTWQILSSDGRVVNSSTATESSAFLQIERGNLPAGVYTLRLQTVGGPVNKRIVFAN